MTTPNQRMSNKHEAEVAAAFGGQVTAMSGAGWVRKHDVYTDFEMIECKATAALGYRVGISQMNQMVHHALLAGKRAVLNIKVQPGGGIRSKRYVVLTEDDYLELSRKAGER